MMIPLRDRYQRYIDSFELDKDRWLMDDEEPESYEDFEAGYFDYIEDDCIEKYV